MITFFKHSTNKNKEIDFSDLSFFKKQNSERHYNRSPIDAGGMQNGIVWKTFWKTLEDCLALSYKTKSTLSI